MRVQEKTNLLLVDQGILRSMVCDRDVILSSCINRVLSNEGLIGQNGILNILYTPFSVLESLGLPKPKITQNTSVEIRKSVRGIDPFVKKHAKIGLSEYEKKIICSEAVRELEEFFLYASERISSDLRCSGDYETETLLKYVNDRLKNANHFGKLYYEQLKDKILNNENLPNVLIRQFANDQLFGFIFKKEYRFFIHLYLLEELRRAAIEGTLDSTFRGLVRSTCDIIEIPDLLSAASSDSEGEINLYEIARIAKKINFKIYGDQLDTEITFLAWTGFPNGATREPCIILTCDMPEIVKARIWMMKPYLSFMLSESEQDDLKPGKLLILSPQSGEIVDSILIDQLGHLNSNNLGI